MSKLHFTLALAKQHDACTRGIKTFTRFLKDNNIQYDDNTEFNLLTLLESNGVEDAQWALRCCVESTYWVVRVSKELSKRGADRAVTYSIDGEKAAQENDLKELLEAD
jgi:hypothetical protein